MIILLMLRVEYEILYNQILDGTKLLPANVNFSLVSFCDIHLSTISQQVTKVSRYNQFENYIFEMYSTHKEYISNEQCWKSPQVRQSEAGNFGGGLESFC